MSELPHLVAPNQLVADLWTLQWPGIKVYVQEKPSTYKPEINEVIQAEIDRLADENRKRKEQA